MGYRLQASVEFREWADVSDQASGTLLYRINNTGGTNRFFRLRSWRTQDPPITLAILGDSTVADFKVNNNWFSGQGVGMYRYFKPNVRVVNLAQAYHSTKVFLSSAEMQKMLAIVIDLNQLSKDLFNKLGESKSAYVSWSEKDRIHFLLRGAEVIAGLVVNAFPNILRPHVVQNSNAEFKMKVLASDDFEGRAPGTRGEELTVNYLVQQCQRLGLKPGNPDGTYIQNVPMVGFTPRPNFSYEAGGQKTEVAFPAECVVWSRWFVPEVTVADSEMVFVGYGVVAPEYGWDDFKDVDVRGKTIVMLVNDPAIPDPNDPAKLDDKTFKGRAMTYYGRWTYKYEIAAAKGAAAAIIVHETGPAGYPYFVLVSSNSRENFDLQSPNQNRHNAAVEGWITLDQAKKLFAAAGHDFDTLKKQAIRRDFRPISFGAKADFRIQTSLREVASRNVVALLEGSDPRLKDEYVVFSAHWDHLGKNPKMEGDQIFNGALDNASGAAALLELAQAFTQIQPRPKRPILFLFTTAEEKGLLGAKYYAMHPPYPLAKTLANLNIDVVNPWGRTRDVNVIGYGSSTLEDLLHRFADEQGRGVTPDSEPEKGRYYRSDHFEFAKLGVPAIYLKAGIDYLGQPAGFGPKKSEEYTALDYHKVSDDVKPDWDLSGAAEDIRLLFQVGHAVAQGDRFPEWKPGSEFKARREEMLRRVER